jgi:ribosomal protein S18 acetylase RimI-like enzyme
MELKFIFRAMRPTDLRDVMRIQAEAYVDQMIESESVMAERLDAAPETCWIAESSNGACGYLMGYFSLAGEITPWGMGFSPKPHADLLYLHDLAISKRAAGNGLGPRLVNHAISEAKERNLRGAALVSVQDSKGFWQRLGFEKYLELTPAQRQSLASYHGQAFYMMQQFA